MQYELFGSLPKFKIMSLASGSSGNCYYIGNKQYGILIDAGIGMRTIRKSLREYGIALETIMAVLVTHDHADHIKSVAGLGNKLHIPVYATDIVHACIKRSKYNDHDLTQSRRIVETHKPFVIRDLEIVAFEVPHDTIENVGYQIKIGDKTIVLITDVGTITDTVSKYAATANLLILEANYDNDMLVNGRYPDYLKKRISSGMGHLSNDFAGKLLTSIYTKEMDEVWLCHLSKDNNTPEIAYNTVASILKDSDIEVEKDILLKTLVRSKPSGFYEF